MAEAAADEVCGFLVLDKVPGISSFRALEAVKRRLRRGTKVGHAGTLDPFATGVLVVLVGKATRQCERIMALPKEYEATLHLGATSATLDPESPELPTTSAVTPPAPDAVLATLERFVGEIQQVPPPFSAIKVQGRRAYDLARKGEPPQLEPRTVQVYHLELLEYAWPMLRLRVGCGRGFYVRSLARDIGQALGVGAYLKALRRTRIGPFVPELAAPPSDEPVRLLPLDWLRDAGAEPAFGSLTR